MLSSFLLPGGGKFFPVAGKRGKNATVWVEGIFQPPYGNFWCPLEIGREMCYDIFGKVYSKEF